eukprot:scaffold285793_cov30-Tisochrysis_lutea.AAC.1
MMNMNMYMTTWTSKKVAKIESIDLGNFDVQIEDNNWEEYLENAKRMLDERINKSDGLTLCAKTLSGHKTPDALDVPERMHNASVVVCVNHTVVSDVAIFPELRHLMASRAGQSQSRKWTNDSLVVFAKSATRRHVG